MTRASRIGTIVLFACACASPEAQLKPAATDTVAHIPPAVSSTAQEITPDLSLASNAELPSGYSLADTTYWGSMLEEGQRAVLRRDSVTIDTVDIAIGVSFVGKDSVIYMQVQTDTLPFHHDGITTYESFPTEYFLWRPGARRKLSELFPYFNSYFSSPVILSDSTMLYWGIAPRDTTNALYAMRYDFRSARLDSVSLNRQDYLATDYRYHLHSPLLRDKEVLFDTVAIDAVTWRVKRPAGATR